MNIIASTLRLAEVGQSWAVGMYVAAALHMYLCHSCGTPPCGCFSRTKPVPTPPEWCRPFRTTSISRQFFCHHFLICLLLNTAGTCTTCRVAQLQACLHQVQRRLCLLLNAFYIILYVIVVQSAFLFDCHIFDCSIFC